MTLGAEKVKGTYYWLKMQSVEEKGQDKGDHRREQCENIHSIEGRV